MIFRYFLLSLSLCSVLARTEMMPTPSKFDKRTRTVAYEAMEVYKIKGFYGYFTRVEFSPEETEIEYAMGDETAWDAITHRNHLIIKPTKDRPTTNMTVITNKRTYNFILTAEKVPDPTTIGEAPLTAEDLQFLITFTYPQEQAAKRQAENKEYIERQRKEKEEMDKKLKDYQVSAALRDANNNVLNTDYFGCGAEEVLPVAAYDNQQFTFLKFDAGVEIPAVYITDTFGDESLVNYNVQNDWIVIQRTAKEMTLRNGKYVGCLINANRAATRTESGTVSSGVTRKLIPLNENKGS